MVEPRLRLRPRSATSLVGANVAAVEAKEIAITGDFPHEPAMNPETKLKELGLELPPAAAAQGNYVATVQSGNLLFCAGTISLQNGQITHAGQVGREQTVQTGYESARICTLNTLANIKAAVGSLDRVARVVLVSGFVNAISGFADSPAVINGASDLLVAVFGEAGKHARAAVSVAGLPKNSTVEVQLVVELKPA